jgi:lipoate-protein ligase A
MFFRKFIYKIPNGKMLKVFLQIEGNKISNVKITGDFFIHPEETIFLIEQYLEGLPVDVTESRMLFKVNSAVKDAEAELVGVDAESIAFAMFRAINGGQDA